MNFHFRINDIDEPVQTGVVMTLLGHIVKKVLADHENRDLYYTFEVNDQSPIFKRAICGYVKNDNMIFIAVNPSDEEWESIRKYAKTASISDLLESGIERKGGKMDNN